MSLRLRQFVLVWCLLSVSFFWSESRYGVKGDQVSDFLDAKETQVGQIANLAIENSDNTCDLVSSCAPLNQCTRSGCSALKSDNLTCTYVAENQNCIFTSTGGFCDRTNVNFNRSYVRTPANYSSGSVPFEVVNSVCAQRNLDDLFVQLQALQNSSAYYFNFYFGSVDGSFRFFPGVQVKSCYTFDPRLRPWYNGAISVKKDLVILLDAGSSMSNSIDFTSQISRFSTAQIVTQKLLQTLTAGDTATVMTFDSTVEATLLSPPFGVPDSGLNVSDPIFGQLNTSVADAKISGDSNGGSNLTAGLNQAISSFSGMSSDALKIVVLFTDGGFSSDSLGSIISELTNQSIRLITYEFVSTGSTPSPVLRTLSCQVDGLTEQLNPRNLVQNPLFAVKSYFSFLARSQKEITRDAFWQGAYRDFGSLGSIITVALPAMSSDGELIGVAGIDVQVGGLDQSFRDQLNGQISDRRTDISINPNGSTFDDCKPAYNDSLGQCNAKSGFTPFCAQDNFHSTYAELACCPGCLLPADLGSPGSGFSKSLIIIVVCSVLAALTLLGLSVCFWYKCYRPYGQEVDPFLKIPQFSYKSLYVATDKFSDLLGKGTFGSVFKGTLKDGSLVAVKKLLHQPNFSDFQAEIRVLATANHINLVALKGFCTEQHELLVYEFVRNKDLDHWLFESPKEDKNLPKILAWNHRVLIARGVAKGLAYLHENLQHSQRVYHSDIKPANILLDADFNPKLGDFGMAKLYKNGSEMFASGGTLGYIAPEIHAGEPATTKADVYSYGMVLLEMVSGKKFNDPSLEGTCLPLWAATKENEPFDSDVIDPRLGPLSEAEKLMAQRLIRIALLCTSKASDQRPEMSAVEQMIKGGAPISSIPLNYDSQESNNFSNTFSTETSSLGLSRPRSDGIPESRPFAHAHPRSLADIFHRMRAGVSTPFY